MGPRGGVARRIERGEVRLYNFGGSDKVRPVVVLTRKAAIASLTRLTVVPVTSTVRGVATEVVLGVEDGMKRRSVANLLNVVTVEKVRLGRRVACLGPERMLDVCRALNFALGCDR